MRTIIPALSQRGLTKPAWRPAAPRAWRRAANWGDHLSEATRCATTPNEPLPAGVGAWRLQLRTRMLPTLTAGQVTELDDRLPRWRLTIQDARWRLALDQILERPGAHERDWFHESPRERAWLDEQRRASAEGTMKPERARALDAELPAWRDLSAARHRRRTAATLLRASDKRAAARAASDARWLAKAAEVGEYIRGLHRLPTSAENQAVFLYLGRLRRSHHLGQLTEDQVATLTRLIPEWDALAADRKLGWMRELDRLSADASDGAAGHGELDAWLGVQVALHARGELRGWQVSALDDRFTSVWRGGKPRASRAARASRMTHEERWAGSLLSCVEHVAATGLLPPGGTAEGEWVSTNRRVDKRGAQVPDRVARLDAQIPGWRTMPRLTARRAGE